jgi:hypothetical protein
MPEIERNRRSAPSDPTGIEEPHDILAAEEFGIPTRDNRIPGDPTGLREPHDVLAAEEFAMPAGAEPHREEQSGLGARAYLPLALAALILLLVFRRRR